MLSSSEETCVILVNAKLESDQSCNLQWAENHHSILKRLEHARYPEQKPQKSSNSPNNLQNTCTNANFQLESCRIPRILITHLPPNRFQFTPQEHCFCQKFEKNVQTWFG